MTIQFILQYDSADLGHVVDMGNATAHALLRAVGLPTGEAWGELSVSEFGPVIERCLRLANGLDVDEFAVPCSSGHGELRQARSEGNLVHLERGAAFIDMGVDGEKLQRRAGELLRLLVQGREDGVGVQWM